MTDTTRTLSIIAYYLSEYDVSALQALGYRTQSTAFKEISSIFGKDNNYLKLRRDEFDALPNSSSRRNGWRNRPAVKEVVNLAAYLKGFSFDQLTDLVKALIDAQSGALLPLSNSTAATSTSRTYSETELENIINFEDPNATVAVKITSTSVRIYNPSIIRQLKNLYNGECQLCGCSPLAGIACDLTEVHHIDHFASSHNNNASNLIVLCPNHHRLVHKMNPTFDRKRLCFVFSNAVEESIKLNYHL